MADELKLTWSIIGDKEPPMVEPISMNVFNQLRSLSTGKFQKGTCTASHSATVAVDLGDAVGNCGYFAFKNPSETETINLYTGSAGTIWAEMGPLDSGVLKIPVGATPYAKAAGSIDVTFPYIIYAR